MRAINLRLFGLLAIATSLGGCLPSFTSPSEIDWDPEFAMPLAHTSVNVQDLLTQSAAGGLLTVDPDNMMRLVYSSPKNSATGLNPLEVNEFPIPIVDSIQDTDLSSLAPLRLDVMRLSGGKLKYTATNPFLEDVDVILMLEDITFGGSPVQLSFTVPATTNPLNPTTYSDSIQIPGRTISFANYSFKTTYTAVTALTNTHVELPLILLEMKDLEYAYLEGYFGADTFALDSGVVDISIFEDWTGGTVVFEEPEVRFRFDNGLGIPVSIQSDSVIFSTNLQGKQYLASNDLTNGFAINYPTLNEIGQKKTSLLTLNAANSNLKTALAGVPYRVDYAISLFTNPDNNTSLDNFYSAADGIDVYMDVEVPIYGTAAGFGTSDTFSIDLTSLEQVEKMGFKVIADNGMPFDVGMQGYFYDSQWQVVDSLFTEYFPKVIASAPVDNNGFVTSPQETITTVALDAARLTELRNRAVKMILRTKVSTKDEGSVPVRVLTTYGLDIKIGVTVGL